MKLERVWRRAAAMALAVGVLAPTGSDAQLSGDPEAVAAVNTMIDALGGAELWTGAHTLEVFYRGWSQSVEGPVVERAWRDLTRPNQRIEIETRDAGFTIIATDREGWRVQDGASAAWDRDEVARHNIFWPKDFYTLIRRLAASDPDLWVEQFEGADRIVVFSRTQGELGWWEIAPDGAIERWGTVDMGEPLAYVYGPMRDYGGGVRFPAWGASLDGSWRFEYSRVALTSAEIDPALLRPSG